MKSIEEALESVKGTMAIEGFILTEDQIDRGRKILEGSLSADDAIAELKAQYSDTPES